MAEEAQSDQEKAKLAVCDLIETHLRDTREKFSKWSSDWKAAGEHDARTLTVQANTSLDQKLGARLDTDGSSLESSDFKGTLTIPNPIIDLLSRSSGDQNNLRTDVLEAWRGLRRDMIPRYLTVDAAAGELHESVVIPYSKRFDKELTRVRPQLNAQHRDRAHALFRKMQIRSGLRTLSDVFGTGDDYRKESHAEWESFRQLLSQANATSTNEGEKWYLPDFGPSVAKATLLLDYPKMHTHVATVLDESGQALQDNRSQMATCEKQGRITEYQERKRLEEEISSLSSYAHWADRAGGGTRSSYHNTGFLSKMEDRIDDALFYLRHKVTRMGEFRCLPKLSKQEMDQWIKDVEEIVTQRDEVAPTQVG